MLSLTPYRLFGLFHLLQYWRQMGYEVFAALLHFLQLNLTLLIFCLVRFLALLYLLRYSFVESFTFFGNLMGAVAAAAALCRRRASSRLQEQPYLDWLRVWFAD
mmetsp:Transcript_80156/g.259627  ORF Transcript_80156/g.259627 Transcript_80156/m.259627 type:complete len:104 (-) Transcript_80156:472-783(-)